MVSFGFWAGDANLREPTYYSYTSPEPTGLREQSLRPDEATWGDVGTSSLALLPYDVVRTAPDPRATLLAFLESAYEAGADAAGWDRADLRLVVVPEHAPTTKEDRWTIPRSMPASSGSSPRSTSYGSAKSRRQAGERPTGSGCRS